MKENRFYKIKQPDGVYKLPEYEFCTDPNHEPPMFISVPHGHGYKHSCPSCGKVSVIENRGPTFYHGG